MPEPRAGASVRAVVGEQLSQAAGQVGWLGGLPATGVRRAWVDLVWVDNDLVDPADGAVCAPGVIGWPFRDGEASFGRICEADLGVGCGGEGLDDGEAESGA